MRTNSSLETFCSNEVIRALTDGVASRSSPRLRALADEHRQALAAGALASSGADDWAGWWEGLVTRQVVDRHLLVAIR